MACGPSHMTAAFKSCNENEAFIFMNNKYIVDNYCPGTASDKIVYGPIPNAQGMYCLTNSIFADRIDGAFADNTYNNRAYIFSGSCVALLEYSACYGPSNAMLVKGPMPITQMFPFLANTIFETGINAAFESSICYEAYLFKGDQCARINYGCNARIMNQGHISELWPCLKDTYFSLSMDAAFASHCQNEVYLFNGDFYTRMRYYPDANNSLISGVKLVKDYWPQLVKVTAQPDPTCN